jgi:zinc transporter
VLQTDRPAWMEKELDRALRETSDRLLRYLEELDAARDRAVVIRDEIANRLSEDMNRTMYALSVVAGIFLPLGMLTGLLGINVGGMPGVESSSAFWVTCILLVVIVAGEIWLFRRMKWI